MAILVLLMGAVCAVGHALTPDLAVLRAAENMNARDPGDNLAREYVSTWVSKEERYISSADCVALGTVTELAVRSFGNPKRPSLYTLVTLSVEQCLRGPCSDELEFVAAGGQIGSYAVEITPAAAYAEGDRCAVVLFWEQSPHGRQLAGISPYSKYIVAGEGTVERKGIHIDQFLEELGELLPQVSVLDDLEEADLVVIGEVTSAWWEWNALNTPWGADEPVPARMATLAVKEVLKGESHDHEITVVQHSPRAAPGRVLAEFRKGEDVLLFLRAGLGGTYELVRGRAGKHDLESAATADVLGELGDTSR